MAHHLLYGNKACLMTNPAQNANPVMVNSNNGEASASSKWRQRDRKPNGKEPGLKTLKRVAYLGQDYVHRYYFGTTPLAIPPARYRREMLGENAPVDEDEEESWNSLWRQTELYHRKIKHDNEWLKANGKSLEVPEIELADLDTASLHTALPGGRKGLGTLEIFMRHCEAWRLHARGEAQ